MIAGATSRAALVGAGDRPLLYDIRGGVRTGKMLAERTARVAGALAARKLTNRKIGLWYWNGLAAIEAFLAVEWIGGTRVPVDPAATVAEAKAVFDAAEVDAILVDRAHAAHLAGAALVHDDDEPLDGPPGGVDVAVSPEATLLLYPRMAAHGELFAVPISYGNWDATMRVNQALYRSGRYGPGFDEDECFLTVQQIMHGTGLLGTFPFLLMGLPQVVVERFDAEVVLDAMARHRVTATFFVPGMVTRLVDLVGHAAGHPPVSLRRVLYGGAPMGVDEMKRSLRALGPVLVQVYGRLEGGWPIAVLGIEEHQAILAGNDALGASCGRPIAEVEIRLRPVPGLPGDRGELCVRGDMVVTEYADPSGWCALGDIARRDDRGYLYLLGRLDRMINTGSYHVYPDEIEAAIRDIPGVAEVRVVGEPDPKWGQAVTAYIVPATPGPAEALLATVREALAQRLARYKVPKAFHVVDRLPEREQ